MLKQNGVSYVRDGRSPIPKNENISKVMSANKGKNTGPELRFRQALRKRNLLGYRLHSKNVPGRPDIVFHKKKLAIFIHGCYWHRCPSCKYVLPKTNRIFWKRKFEANKMRDKNKKKLLAKEGWKTLTIWECQLKKDIDKQVDKVIEFIS
jgi:DNA mismatch endonuclease, patch repair protein